MNLFTLKQCRDFVKRFVDDGSCRDARVDARIDEAMRRLWPEAEIYNSTHRMRIRAENSCFPLPYFAETVISADVDGSPAPVRNRFYEFLSSGPGDLSVRSRGPTSAVIDEGEHPTQWDIPVADDAGTDRVEPQYQLVAFTDSVEDFTSEKKLTIRAFSSRLQEQTISLRIAAWKDNIEGTISGTWSDNFVSSEFVRQISQVYKPVTSGYITLYAVDVNTNRMHFLSKMHPKEERPSYRRYRLMNKCCGATCVLLQVKLRYLTPTADDDILPIQNLDAIKFMIQALREEEAKNLQIAFALEDKAKQLLNKQLARKEVTSGTPVILDFDVRCTLGRTMNRRPI